MPMFRKLLDILRPDKTPDSVQEPVLGPSPHDIIRLKQLRASEEWTTYLGVLDKQMTLYGEGMLSNGARDSAFFHEMRGMCLGLRKAGMLVDDILNSENEREKNSERSRSAEPAWDARAAALFGTSAWNER